MKFHVFSDNNSIMDNNKTINKTYAVVKFKSDSTYSEIPTVWLVENDNKELCWWPPRTANAAMLIASCTRPDEQSWNQYEVDIIKYCCKYSRVLFFIILNKFSKYKCCDPYYKCFETFLFFFFSLKIASNSP